MSAVISKCGRYRYALRRFLDQRGPRGQVLFVMLNPSTADAEHDDPTIRRCIGFALAWGFKTLAVCNVYPLRATNPKDLISAGAGREGDWAENDHHLIENAKNSELVICAWGARVISRSDERHVYALLKGITQPNVLGLTKQGFPKHPLYLRADTQPQPWVRT